MQFEISVFYRLDVSLCVCWQIKRNLISIYANHKISAWSAALRRDVPGMYCSSWFDSIYRTWDCDCNWVIHESHVLDLKVTFNDVTWKFIGESVWIGSLLKKKPERCHAYGRKETGFHLVGYFRLRIVINCASFGNATIVSYKDRLFQLLTLKVMGSNSLKVQEPTCELPRGERRAAFI